MSYRLLSEVKVEAPDDDGVAKVHLAQGSRIVGFSFEDPPVVWALVPTPHPKASETWELMAVTTGYDQTVSRSIEATLPDSFRYVASDRKTKHRRGGCHDTPIESFTTHLFVRRIEPLTRRAGEFAAEAHGEQRYGQRSYFHHLAGVVGVLGRFGFDDDTIVAAAYLHDVVEDTEVTVDQVRDEFGDDVAFLVAAVTNSEGANRAERHEATYPRIKSAGERAVALKLADRISNTEESIRNNPRLLKMYVKEFPAFRQALHTPGEHTAMWTHLDAITNRKRS